MVVCLVYSGNKGTAVRDLRMGYHTFRRGDLVLWTSGENHGAEDNPEDDDDRENSVVEQCVEAVYGVMVFNVRSQQRRFLITFDRSLAKFSINSWVSWKRVFNSNNVLNGDVDNNEHVRTLDVTGVQQMMTAWAQEKKRFTVSTLDQLHKLSLLGPARAAEERECNRRELDRKRKEESKQKREHAAAEKLQRKEEADRLEKKRKADAQQKAADEKDKQNKEQFQLNEQMKRRVEVKEQQLEEQQRRLEQQKRQLAAEKELMLAEVAQYIHDAKQQLQITTTRPREVETSVPANPPSAGTLSGTTAYSAIDLEGKLPTTAGCKKPEPKRDMMLQHMEAEKWVLMDEQERRMRLLIDEQLGRAGAASASTGFRGAGLPQCRYRDALYNEVEEIERKIVRLEGEQRVERLRQSEGELEVLRLELRQAKKRLLQIEA